MRRGDQPTVKAACLLEKSSKDILLTCHLATVEGEKSLVWFASRIQKDHVPLLLIQISLGKKWTSQTLEKSLVDSVMSLAQFASGNSDLGLRKGLEPSELRIYPQELAELILSVHVTKFLEVSYKKPREEFGSVRPMDRYPAIPHVYKFLSVCGQANPMQILVMATGRTRASVNKDVWQSRALQKHFDSNRGEN